MKKRTEEPQNIEYPTEEGKKVMTPEEIDHWKAREVRMRNIALAVRKIREKHGLLPPPALTAGQKKEGFTGTIECPCCKGELRYVIKPGNHHCWGVCSTDGCLSWME